MQRLSKRARLILERLCKMPMGCSDLTSLNDRLHRPDPRWCYINRNADDQYEPDMRAYRSAYSANRRTLDQLWQAGLVDKYADPNDTRRHYFKATEAGAARIGATRRGDGALTTKLAAEISI